MHGLGRSSALSRAAQWRPHPVFYVIGGLILLIVVVGSLAQEQIGSMAQFIGLLAPQPTDSVAPLPTDPVAPLPPGSVPQRPTGSHAQQPTGSVAQHSKSFKQRPEEKKTVAEAKADARVERDLKETKSACRAAAQARLKAPSTASFVYDDVARIRGKKAYVNGSVDVPNGLRVKLRNRYACELAPGGQDRWKVTKVVFESR